MSYSLDKMTDVQFKRWARGNYTRTELKKLKKKLLAQFKKYNM